jgi:choline dehydrogenase-like flavoprotein
MPGSSPIAPNRPTYDYIVIGAGPAGCAVAARLAQSSAETSVALVEAGPAKASMLSDVPLGLAALLPLRSRRNYAYETVPQKGLGAAKAISHADAAWEAAASSTQ